MSDRTLELREVMAGVGPGLRAKLRELIAYRELGLNLVKKELKVRYKNSTLGFFWSMLNPIFYLVVFYVVFTVFLPGGIPRFHVYLLAGLLPWTFFATALYQATGAVTSSAGLLKKIYFPREMLPFSAIGAAMFHFALQFLVFVGFLVVSRYPFTGKAALLVPAALVAELLLIGGISLATAAANVKARDVQYFLELGLLAWFWLTPIVYPSGMVAERMADKSLGGLSLLTIYLANPMSRIVLAFQRGIYGFGPDASANIVIEEPIGWFLKGIGYAGAAGLILLALGWWIFRRSEAYFAEEL